LALSKCRITSPTAFSGVLYAVVLIDCPAFRTAGSGIGPIGSVDHDLSWSGNRIGRLSQDEHLGPSEPRHLDHTHADRLPCRQSLARRVSNLNRG
jgi:hypothetical protein